MILILVLVHTHTHTCTQQFGKEILADEKSEVKHDKIQKILEAASGAAYGTGK